VGLETMGGVSSSGRISNINTGNFSADSLGSNGGSEVHTLSPTETPLPAHTHPFSATTTVSAGQQYVDDRYSSWQPYTLGSYSTVQRSMRVISSTCSADSSASSHSNLPPLAFLNYIIRY
jgi:hypothetical protein